MKNAQAGPIAPDHQTNRAHESHTRMTFAAGMPGLLHDAMADLTASTAMLG